MLPPKWDTPTGRSRPGATDFWLGRDGVASALGGASRKSPGQVSEEFASNTLTGRFTRSD